jgi:hypothetical protein
MSDDGILPWESLERWSARMFFWGAAIIAGGALVVLYDISHGTDVKGILGQVFVGVSWTAVLVGMLGLYPRLADLRPRLAKACAFFAGVGVLGYVVMTAVVLAGVAGLPESTIHALVPVFLPPVGIGSLLAFPLFAVAGLATVAGLTAVFVAPGAAGQLCQEPAEHTRILSPSGDNCSVGLPLTRHAL